jgi:ESCRT-II complex subunit VPS36
LTNADVGLKLRKFESGVRVLQEYGFDDVDMFHRIGALADTRPLEGISPAEVSRALHVSIIVAKEQILLAEQKGFLCRDDTVNGIFFFANKFISSSL